MLSKLWQFETGRFTLLGTPELALIGTPVYLDVEGLPIAVSNTSSACGFLMGLHFFSTASGLMSPVTSRGSGDPS